MTEPHTRDLSVATQLGRVIAIMSDGKPRTLRDIERWSRYGHADTQAAISARLREVCCHGWVKHSSCQNIDGKQVWHYHLSPFPTAEAVAAKAVAA
ncbi:hypothetical protein KAM385_08130 [Aeromonas hydrophila]|uniref:hypothetical protein n=1 Tax=Aeromonas hydrophila TaxID=644 RepID=UPI001CC6D9C8|nr:hypothetical protein [Aeromonas hydrophila]GJC03784.1 hypothetical protein KAM385_08130 [Aeromonas hydrophila]